MKTYSLQWQVPGATAAGKRFESTLTSAGLLAKASRWSLAAAAALTILFGAIWAATTPSAADILAAGLWAAAFLFFALAVDSQREYIAPFIATGIVLSILAVLGSRVTAEFSILGAVIVATWVATGLAQRK